MIRRFGIPMVLAASIVAATLGLTRLGFDTDILSMMPDDLPEVKGLKAYQKGFARTNEVIAVIEEPAADGDGIATAAESLSRALTAAGVAEEVRWKPVWDEQSDDLAELLAYVWLNGEPETTAALVSGLSPGNSAATLQQAVERIATAMEGTDMVMRSHDPFGFLAHPAVAEWVDQASGGNGFESGDGGTHLVFIQAPAELQGYRQAAAWLAEVRDAIARWQTAEGAGLKVRLTGEPAFSSEIGMAMETDLSGSIGVTLGLIGLLFWWMQRRFSLLLGLVGVLVLVFAVALGLAGWFYGKLSIIALSSSEILIGLAVDYGLVICQEAKVARHESAALRRACTPPVFFGALTTAVVFLGLNFGGLPGMAQLGSIVAVGLTAAAVLMLVIYLPFVVRFGVNREPARGSGRVLPRSRLSLMITGALILAAIAVLAVNGLPRTGFDANIMRPRHSEAMAAFERIQQAFPPGSEETPLPLVVEASTEDQMLDRLREARRRVEAARASGLIAGFSLPDVWWPDPTRQQANRPQLAEFAANRDRLLDEAAAAGFTAEGLALGKAVMAEISRLTATGSTAFPDTPLAREAMRLFLTRTPGGGGFLAGSVSPAAGIDPTDRDFARMRELTGGGVWLGDWELFKPAMAKLVREELPLILVPMGLLLVGMMAAIFRRLADVVLALLAMALSTLLLLAVMSATGLEWNFVNLMATPLLLGTGIDYAIHVTLSLRRTGGDFRELWQGTGKALLFCGASNVIGFGSLTMSSNDALVSLGITAVIGILLCMAVSIFLLPGWRGATIEPLRSPVT